MKHEVMYNLGINRGPLILNLVRYPLGTFRPMGSVWVSNKNELHWSVYAEVAQCILASDID